MSPLGISFRAARDAAWGQMAIGIEVSRSLTCVGDGGIRTGCFDAARIVLDAVPTGLGGSEYDCLRGKGYVLAPGLDKLRYSLPSAAAVPTRQR